MNSDPILKPERILPNGSAMRVGISITRIITKNGTAIEMTVDRISTAL